MSHDHPSRNTHRFALWYTRWWPVARDAARAFLPREADADDVAQLMFRRLFANGQWRFIDDPKAYLWTAARQEAAAVLRRRERLVRLDEVASRLRDSHPPPDEAVHRREFWEMNSACVTAGDASIGRECSTSAGCTTCTWEPEYSCWEAGSEHLENY